jgi:hypothetical protein
MGGMKGRLRGGVAATFNQVGGADPACYTKADDASTETNVASEERSELA